MTDEPGPESGGPHPDLRELDPEKERAGILALLQEIYPGVPPALMAARFDAIGGSGWRCAGAFVDGELVAVSGFWVQTRFYCGRYLYVDHFVLTARLRSRGLGRRMLDFLHDIAVAEGCELTCLDTFLANGRAQEFWKRAGYQPVGLHFTRPAAPAARTAPPPPAAPTAPPPAGPTMGERVA